MFTAYKDEDLLKSRKKRATLGKDNTCFLYLRSDPAMYEFVQKEKFKKTLVS